MKRGHKTYTAAYTVAQSRADATRQPQAIEYDRPSGEWLSYAVETAPKGVEIVQPKGSASC